MSDLLRQLEVFVVLARTRSFTVAARELGISQPSVSRHIQSFEEEVGQDLVIRDKHRVNLTATGEELFLKADPLLGSASEILAGLKDASSRLSGRLAFGCFAEVGMALYFPFLLEFQRRYPEVEIETQYLKTPDLLEGLKSGDLSVAVLAEAPPGAHLVSYDLMVEESVLVAAPGFAWKPHCGQPLPLVAYRKQDPLLLLYVQQFGRALGLSTPQVQIRVSVNAHQSMLEAVGQGLGAAVVPLFRVRKELEAGSLVQVADPLLRCPQFLVHLYATHLPRLTRVFRSEFIAAFRDGPALKNLRTREKAE